jgi:ABC-type Fe3+-hydroxamate transport system substrate-binding protein
MRQTMTDSGATKVRLGRGPRSVLFGIGLSGVVLAAVIGTPAALVVATGRTCACAQPPDLVVTNADTSPVTVAWRLQGVSLVPDEPASGTVVVAACDGITATLPEGTVDVVVTSAASMDRFALEIPHLYARDPIGYRVVREDGAIEDAGPRGPADEPLAGCAAADDEAE